MVTFRTMLDSPKKPHWGITSQIFIELHCIEIFNCNPSKYSPENKYDNYYSIEKHIMEHLISSVDHTHYVTNIMCMVSSIV